jgi:hypothetical protein
MKSKTKSSTHLLVHTIDIGPLLHQILHDVNSVITTGLKQRRIASLQEQQEEKEKKKSDGSSDKTVQDKTRQTHLLIDCTVVGATLNQQLHSVEASSRTSSEQGKGTSLDDGEHSETVRMMQSRLID